MTGWHRLCPAAAIGLALWSGDPERAEGAQITSFFEPFDTLDRSRWRVSDEWFNGPWQNCIWSDQNVTIEEGLLILTLDQTMAGPRDYACGEIQTHERYLYGTYEVRMRSPAASGVNAAFFSYIGPVHEVPHGEVDIEILTRDPSRVSFNTYVNAEPMHGATAALPVRADEEFITMGFVRSPGRIQWFIDGAMVYEATGELPTRPQKIFLSLWGTDTLTDWMGPFEAEALPLRMEVDWVAFTAPGARCRFPQSLTCLIPFTFVETAPVGSDP